jgi:hypothetical protein
VVLIAIGSVVAIACSVYIATGILLAFYRRSDLSLLRFWFNGWAWFSSSTFRPEARALWRIFVGAFVVAMVSLLALALASILLGP